MGRTEKREIKFTQRIAFQLDKIGSDFHQYGKHIVEGKENKDEKVFYAYIFALGLFLYDNLIEKGEELNAKNFLGNKTDKRYRKYFELKDKIIK